MHPWRVIHRHGHLQYGFCDSSRSRFICLPSVFIRYRLRCMVHQRNQLIASARIHWRDVSNRHRPLILGNSMMRCPLAIVITPQRCRIYFHLWVFLAVICILQTIDSLRTRCRNSRMRYSSNGVSPFMPVFTNRNMLQVSWPIIGETTVIQRDLRPITVHNQLIHIF